MGCGLSRSHPHLEALVSHANARTTFKGRLLIVERHQAGWPQAHIAKAMGISRQCVQEVDPPLRREGEAGLHDRSSRPHSSPTRTAAEVEDAGRAAARRERRRAGLDRRRAGRAGPHGVAGPAPPRHAAAGRAGPDHRAGDPVLEGHRGPLRTRPARRAGPHGREEDRPDPRRRRLARPRPQARRSITRDRNTRVGYDYVHSLVDDHSRLAYSEILADEKGTTCAAFLARADRLLRRPRHHPDRAADDRQRLGLPVLPARGLRRSTASPQKFISPHCPWQNGKVERLNRTLATEWAYRQVFTSNDERAAALAPWLEHYNTQRRHSALGGLPPISRLSPT